jgi:surface protein
MAFIFKVTTTSSPQTFTIPCANFGVFNATVDWGDGGPTSSITAYNDGDLAHSYATAGQYTITITGTFPNIYFNNGGDKLLVDEVVDLGDVGWLRFNNAFHGCSNMTAFNSGTADTSGVTHMSYMFLSCPGLTSLDVSGFNTSSVTTMLAMFFGCSSLTSLDVSSFNTANVTDMTYMFYNCNSLTSVDVSGFNTASVTTMLGMFQNCTNLTGLQISGWDVSSVTGATSFLLNANNALSTQEYNNTLRAWSQQSVQSGVTWHFGDATYDETHPDTGYYLDFDGLDDNMILDADDIAGSTNATLYKTFRGDSTDTLQIMFGTAGAPYILLAASGNGSTAISSVGGSPVYREDGTIPSYTTRGDVFTALVDNTDHTIGVEEADLSASAGWTSSGFYIGGEYDATFNNTGRLYAWAAVDTRLDGRNRDLLENFMISRKAA